jgi:hypothetical protein
VLINGWAIAVIIGCFVVGWEALFYIMIGVSLFENLSFGMTIFPN